MSPWARTGENEEVGNNVRKESFDINRLPASGIAFIVNCFQDVFCL